MSMVINGSLNTTSYALDDGSLYLTLSWTRTNCNYDTKKSTISWTLKGAGTSTQWANTRNINVKINGTSVYSTSSDPIQLESGNTVKTGTKELTHDSNGQCTFSISVSANIYTTASTVSGTQSFTLYPLTKLTVNYYSNYATESSDNAINEVGLDKNVLVHTQQFSYDTNYTDGLLNYSSANNFMYMKKIGNTPTGYWGTETNGGKLVHEDRSYTGQSLATALGKDITTKSQTINVYAQWSPNTIKLTLNKNGGSGGTDYVYYKYGTNKYYSDISCLYEITKIEIPIKTGHSFNYYYGDGTCGGTENEIFIYDTTMFKSDLCTDIYQDATLYANWTLNTYSIQYNTNGGNGTFDAQTKTYGIDVLLYEYEPTRSGYLFDHWNTSMDGNGSIYYPGSIYTNDADLTLYAIWKYANVCLKKVDGEWKKYNTYYKKDGKWMPCIVYKKDTDGIWKQGII